MVHILYVSKAKDLTYDEIQQILNDSLSKNKNFGITGSLVYTKNHFLQCLEGNDQLIEEVYERISKDPRHYDIQLIEKVQITTRKFYNWNMSMVNESVYQSIVKKYCPNEDDSFYTMQPEELVRMIKEITLVV